MVAHEHGNVIGSGVPRGLTRHLVMDEPAVNLQTLEGNVANLTLFVVAIDDGEAMWHFSIIADIAEGDVLYTTSRSGAVFVVPTHFHLCDATLLYLLYTDIVEGDVANQVIIAAIDGQTTLIVYLWFGLSEDVEVLVAQVLNSVAAFRIAVQTYHYGMRNVGPKRGVAHGHIADIAIETLAGGVCCGAVVGVAAEHAVEEDVRTAAENVKSVAP